ncbi:MAG: radical SAM protein, partial [Clostridia bacterium]|nr:radical SAM protein [Clostridia bacterium]
MKHANVSIFVPQIGCPHRCSFCNQYVITGQERIPSEEEIAAAVQTAVRSGADPENSEIAFFGGSFTAIEPEARRALLEAAYPFVRMGLFRGIRISTRPDAISDEILDELKSFGVTAIELGAQSMEDAVLVKNRRGHTALDTVRASGMIRDAGFSLGLQMMTGLYGQSAQSALETAETLIRLKPDTVRIYPTIIMPDTELAALYERGEYRPQELSEAVDLCARLIDLFRQAGILVIRAGLHDEEGLRERRVAGPYHPAFRELCESRI